MAEKQEQCCKACRWFSGTGGTFRDYGICGWMPEKLPASYHQLHLYGMGADEGTSCPTYQAKESK